LKDFLHGVTLGNPTQVDGYTFSQELNGTGGLIDDDSIDSHSLASFFHLVISRQSTGTMTSSPQPYQSTDCRIKRSFAGPRNFQCLIHHLKKVSAHHHGFRMRRRAAQLTQLTRFLPVRTDLVDLIDSVPRGTDPRLRMISIGVEYGDLKSSPHRGMIEMKPVKWRLTATHQQEKCEQ
jgi:hypothetical protein